MKSLKLIILMLVVANIGLASYSFATPQLNETIVTISQIETLSKSETPECHSGGIGAISCSISAGIQFDLGVSGGCSVTCISGYYACCNLRCECKKYPQKPSE